MSGINQERAIRYMSCMLRREEEYELLENYWDKLIDENQRSKKQTTEVDFISLLNNWWHKDDWQQQLLAIVEQLKF